MPIGLLMLVSLSIVVSRHARQMGRNSTLWVILLWLSCLGGGYASAWLVVSFLPAEDMLTRARAQSSLFVPTTVGMVFGAIAVVFGVNRTGSGQPRKLERIESEEENLEPNT